MNNMNTKLLSKTLLRRTSILLQLQAAYPAALTSEMLLRGIKLNCVPLDEISENLLESDIAYLEEKNYLKRENAELCAAVKRISLSAKGLDYLDMMGF